MKRWKLAEHGSRLLCLVWVLLHVCVIPSHAQETEDSTTVNKAQADTLYIGGGFVILEGSSRSGGFPEEKDYEAELEGERKVLALKRQDEGTKAHEITDAEWKVATLERVVGFSDEQKREYEKAVSLDDILARRYNQAGFGQDALYLRENVARWRRLFDFEHPNVASNLQLLGASLMHLGDYAGAEPLLREALAIWRTTLGPRHPDLVFGLGDLGRLYQYQRQYALAKPLLEEALLVTREALGEEDPNVAVCMANLGMLLWKEADADSAESLMREAIALGRRTLGSEHAFVAATLNNLGSLFRSQADYVNAEPLLREALATRCKIFKPRRLPFPEHDPAGGGRADGKRPLRPRHPEVAESLNSLGLLFFAKGDYANSEPLLREALAIWHSLDSPKVRTALHNLGTLLQSQGDYAGAELLHREALQMSLGSQGTEDPGTAQNMYELGWDLYMQGEDAAAESLLQAALEIRRKTLNPTDVELAGSLSDLGMILKNRGDFARAESHYREALGITRRGLGRDHPDVAVSLMNLGLLMQEQEDHASAEASFREALDIGLRGLGPEHPRVSMILQCLASTRGARGDHEEAEELLTQAAEVHDVARLQVGSGLERATFAFAPYRHLAVTRLVIGKDTEAWPTAERAQARVLTDLLLAAGQRELSVSETAREDSLQRLQVSLEKQLEFLLESDRTDSTIVAEKRVVEVRDQLFETQAALSSHLREMADNHPVTEGEIFPLERVQAALPEKAALIGWLDVSLPGGREGGESWCYVIRDTGPVHWSRIVEMDSQSASSTERLSPFQRTYLFRRDLQVVPLSGSVAEVMRRGRELWAERIAPMMKHLKGVEELIVIPSGAMLGVPVETLMDPNGDYLADSFNVSYTPSATIHTWLEERRAQRDGPPACSFLLVGDPIFSREPMKPETTASFDRSLIHSVLVGNERALEHLGALSLPHTRVEVDRISKLCPQAELLLGENASEQGLVGLAESGRLEDFSVIHIATHAFADDSRAERSALMLSQVGLPDAREAALQGTRIYDGRLTVKEILGEWKLDADLVTLSACQTALGEAIPGEGLVGFSYAFLQRGAHSLLLSLWNVDDRATSLLMERFYENLLGVYADTRGGCVSEPMSKVKALQEAKQYLRTYADDWDLRPYEHPFFWAGFVLIGGRD